MQQKRTKSQTQTETDTRDIKKTEKMCVRACVRERKREREWVGKENLHTFFFSLLDVVRENTFVHVNMSMCTYDVCVRVH